MNSYTIDLACIKLTQEDMRKLAVLKITGKVNPPPSLKPIELHLNRDSKFTINNEDHNIATIKRIK